MNADALKSLAASLAKAGAPILGGALGGPVGAAVAGTVIGALADALGVDATPEAVQAKVEADPAAAGPIVARVEATQGAAVEELAARLADVQDARQTTVELVQAGSPIAWGAPVVSFVVIAGFAILSYLAIYAPQNQREVLLFLLGAWSALATAVVQYWVGSSNSSQRKDDSINSALARAVTPAARAVENAVNVAVGRSRPKG